MTYKTKEFDNQLSFYNLQFNYMINALQIDEEGNIIDTKTNYLSFLASEEMELIEAEKNNNIIEQIDAMCDIIVCSLGCLIQRKTTDSIMEKIDTFTKQVRKFDYDFDKCLYEVFRNNYERAVVNSTGYYAKDENGKVIKKNLTPNFEKCKIIL